ncbi:hypothetical protein GY45DRAFT_1242727 [Cubamyces sp. BRFM 1775]|nr:hypothetical protein GY45DRAFT_1242727 [Cubamyces sp. BRFM 1775]
METVDRELELRAHIHSLLSQYAFTHLTTDYVHWTERSVADRLSECLHPIPTTDSTAVALPVDPFELLSQRWKLQKLDPFDERWKVTDADAVGYLKAQVGAIRSRPSVLESDRSWGDTDGETPSTIPTITSLTKP